MSVKEWSNAELEIFIPDTVRYEAEKSSSDLQISLANVCLKYCLSSKPVLSLTKFSNNSFKVFVNSISFSSENLVEFTLISPVTKECIKSQVSVLNWCGFLSFFSE